MIAIHDSNTGFHPRWKAYCEEKNILYKTVNCYSNDIFEHLKDCKALMWHHSQGNPKDLLIAKQILYALEHTGFKVFPNFFSNWHFDDKLGQKYLLERIGAPFVPSYIFFDKNEALSWCNKTSYPKVFKLRRGAGSANVKLVVSKAQANQLIKKAFSNGFSNYNSYSSFIERYRKWSVGKTDVKDLLKGIIRFFHKPNFTKVIGNEFGYVYFQEFIPNNVSDTRIIVIGNKAFALKRYVRKNDFRASGSGDFGYAKELFDERCVSISFDVVKKLQLQIGVFDFVFDSNNNPLIVEISYGYSPNPYDSCLGYWDENLNWFEGEFNHVAWMVDDILKN